jgi:hypothetical protein
MISAGGAGFAAIRFIEKRAIELLASKRQRRFPGVELIGGQLRRDARLRGDDC